MKSWFNNSLKRLDWKYFQIQSRRIIYYYNELEKIGWYRSVVINTYNLFAFKSRRKKKGLIVCLFIYLFQYLNLWIILKCGGFNKDWVSCLLPWLFAWVLLLCFHTLLEFSYTMLTLWYPISGQYALHFCTVTNVTSMKRFLLSSFLP